MQLRLAAVLLACAVAATALVPSTSAAATDAQKCLAKKLKEMGKYDGCRLKADAKGVLRGEAPDYSRCASTLTAKWDRIEAAGGCVFLDDYVAPQGITDTHTADVYVLLSEGVPAVCGDSSVNGSEACDGTDLAGESCVSQGFTGGTLACDGSCQFDTSSCVLADCGNGTLEVGEQCDGTNLNGLTCFYLGYSYNAVPQLACDGTCQFDTSACTQSCGDGVIDASALEQCDGSNLNGQDCTSYPGGTGGTLACSPRCHFDFSGCTGTCGDGLTGPNEACDGTSLNGATCATLGFVGGTLTCNGSCQFDTSGCTATCGDDIVSKGAGEDCDGTDPGSAADCTFLGYTSGSLSCSGSCTYDVSACTNECSILDQDCPGGDGCYFGVDGFGGCQAPGSGGYYDVCTVQPDCAPGHLCTTPATTEKTCVPVCDTTLGNADCPAGYSCLAGNLPGQPNLGICVVMF